jgi:glyoxylase-like metal-dependent hydrolase (beta-lactamase superfamily II)
VTALFVLSTLIAGSAAAQDARSLLQAADKAVGASAVNSIQFDATGWIRFLGQNFTAEDDWNRVDLQSYTQTIDYVSRSAKEEYVRVQGNNPRIGGGAGFPIVGAPRTTNFVNGFFAWTLNAQGQPQAQPTEAEVRQFMLWVTPHGFIKAALADNGATVSDRHFVRTGQTMKVIGFTTMGRFRATGEFNNQNLLERVVTWIPSPVMGDMQVEIRYSDYRDVGSGAKFPFHIHMHQGDHPFLGGRNLMDLAITKAAVNIANPSPPVPDAVRTAKPPVVNVTTTQLAPGVWLLAGGSHNSVAVEFRDYITVIEGPLDDDRANAVIATAKKTIPNKPIRYLVNTHHHWDHAGGIRAFAAEGATIVTHESNKDFYERIVLAPQSRSLSPDRLSRFPFATTGPGPQRLETFAERHAISDGTQTIITYHVEGLNHAGDMGIVYLPGPKLLVSADMGPPAPGTPVANVNANSVTLYNNIRRLKLDVTQHVPIHGNPSSHADFEKTVGPAAQQQTSTATGGN